MGSDPVIALPSSLDGDGQRQPDIIVHDSALVGQVADSHVGCGHDTHGPLWGGVTGIAWELGILRGLAEAGVDLSDADLVIGTSAGSVVGAQIASGRSELRPFRMRELAQPA